jgi:hypothetical protein
MIICFQTLLFNFNLRHYSQGNLFLLVGRCRMTLLCPQTDPTWFQRLNLKYYDPLSHFAYNCSLRPYILGRAAVFAAYLALQAPNLQAYLPVTVATSAQLIGGAVQVDPGVSQLTPRLLSTLETKIR